MEVIGGTHSWMWCCSYRYTLGWESTEQDAILTHCFSFYLSSTPSVLGAVRTPAGGSTITCGSTGLSRGGVRAGCTLLILKDSDRGGRLGSEILLATLCGIAGELWRLSRERSSTCGTRGGEWVTLQSHAPSLPGRGSLPASLLNFAVMVSMKTAAWLCRVLRVLSGHKRGPCGPATFTRIPNSPKFTQLSSHRALLQAINTTRKPKRNRQLLKGKKAL